MSRFIVLTVALILCSQLQAQELLSLFSKSPLQVAIDKGLKPGGDLAKELEDLDDYELSMAKDARAICRALKEMPQPAERRSKKAYKIAEYSLAVLFQDIESADCPAYPILREEGIPQLIRIFGELSQRTDKESKDAAMFTLKMLAMYGTKEGTDTIIQAARRSFEPKEYLWTVVLGQFDKDHPQASHVFQSLSNPLPRDFAAISLLDAANEAIREGLPVAHPFDSASGVKQLEAWLKNPEEEEFSYAHSAAAALPFIHGPRRDELLKLAMNHVNPGVQMEASWAAASLGTGEGIERLKKFCLDVHRSYNAQQYLTELDQESQIPKDCLADEFRARAEFSYWLQHPNELARVPDEVTVFDTRTLKWPVDGERQQQWLIRFRAKATNELDDDDIGIGLVGSRTWCFFEPKLLSLAPEDCYAIHCYWELQTNGDISDEESMKHCANRIRESKEDEEKEELESMLDAHRKTLAKLFPNDYQDILTREKLSPIPKPE